MKDMERETAGASMTDSERKEMEKAMAKDIYKRSGASTTKSEMKRMARKGKR